MPGMNINQLPTAAASILATDKMYLGRSPFGVTDDRYILGSVLIGQLAPLTTKGDIYTFTTVNARLPVAVGDGKILQVSSGAATGLAYSTPTYPSASGAAGKIIASDGTNNVYSTATFPVVGGAAGNILISDGTNYIASTSLWPNTVGTVGKIIRSNGTSNAYTTSTFADTYAVSTLLYASSVNVVSGLATANSSVLVTTSAGVPVQSGTMTNGQMIIGSTGATPAVGTITVSGNLVATTGAGTFALSLSGTASNSWVVETTTSRTLTAFQSVFSNNSGLVTLTVPATAAVGDTFEVAGLGAGGWLVRANTGQVINLGNTPTTSAGSLASTNRYDSVKFVCAVANTTFVAVQVVGNLTVA